MSSVTQTNNGQQSRTVYDYSKIFIWNNRYKKANFTNSTYDTVELVAGTVMGRVTATLEIIPLISSASDGSEIPVGILAHDVSVEEGATVELTFCNGGDVVEGKVVLSDEGDDLDTEIDGRILRDLIAAEANINLVPSTEMTAEDNE